MNVRLPCTSGKRYLTGMDWIVAALNHNNQRLAGGNNASQIVLELRQPLDAASFQKAVDALAARLPVLAGRMARNWNLVPVWSIPRRTPPGAVRIESVQAEEPAVPDILAASVNAPFRHPREHVVFRVVHAGGRSWLAMQFDHALFDASGAEAFLDLLSRLAGGEDIRARVAALALTEPAHLSEWKRKFDCGKLLVRLLRLLAQSAPMAFPRPPRQMHRPFRFRLHAFDEATSAAIMQRAYEQAGYLMFLPYALARGLQAFDPLFRAHGNGGTRYVVSVSVDARTPETAARHVFFNRLSFLIFHMPVESAADGRKLLDLVKTQMYEQIKTGFPAALAESSMLTRIFPLSVVGRALLMPLRGEFASLGFTVVGKDSPAPAQFMGVEVANLIHTPRIPVPPGVGLVLSQYRDRLNVSLCYLDGLISDEAADRVMADFCRLLRSAPHHNDRS